MQNDKNIIELTSNQRQAVFELIDELRNELETMYSIIHKRNLDNEIRERFEIKAHLLKMSIQNAKQTLYSNSFLHIKL